MPTAVAAPPNPLKLIKTKAIDGRRTVGYQCYDDLVRDAERLANAEVKTIGNWSFAQILDHLAKSTNAMIDGVGFAMPLPIRAAMRLLMKRKMLTESIPPGYKFPESVADKFAPTADATIDSALEALRAAVDRAKSTPDRSLHPAFGQMTRDEWDEFQLRHYELHMSFVVPVAG